MKKTVGNFRTLPKTNETESSHIRTRNAPEADDRLLSTTYQGGPTRGKNGIQQEIPTYDQGTFSRDERRRISDAVETYMNEFDVPKEDLHLVINPRTKLPGANGANPYSKNCKEFILYVLASSKVNRSVDQMYYYLKRAYSPLKPEERSWTPDQDASLLEMHLKGTPWAQISRELGRADARDRFRVLQRHTGLNIGRWTDDEMKLLIDAVKEIMDRQGLDYSTKLSSWTEVSLKVKTRDASQCSQKWREYMVPRVGAGQHEMTPDLQVKLKWTREDDLQLLTRLANSCADAQDESDIMWDAIIGDGWFWGTSKLKRRWNTWREIVPEFESMTFSEAIDYCLNHFEDLILLQNPYKSEEFVEDSDEDDDAQSTEAGEKQLVPTSNTTWEDAALTIDRESISIGSPVKKQKLSPEPEHLAAVELTDRPTSNVPKKKKRPHKSEEEHALSGLTTDNSVLTPAAKKKSRRTSKEMHEPLVSSPLIEPSNISEEPPVAMDAPIDQPVEAAAKSKKRRTSQEIPTPSNSGTDQPERSAHKSKKRRISEAPPGASESTTDQLEQSAHKSKKRRISGAPPAAELTTDLPLQSQFPKKKKPRISGELAPEMTTISHEASQSLSQSPKKDKKRPRPSTEQPAVTNGMLIESVAETEGVERSSEDLPLPEQITEESLRVGAGDVAGAEDGTTKVKSKTKSKKQPRVSEEGVSVATSPKSDSNDGSNEVNVRKVKSKRKSDVGEADSPTSVADESVVISR